MAASQGDDSLAFFSNYGQTTVHLMAPGASILSTYASATNSYVQLSGTSMSCPVVSGAASLLWAAKPEATYADIK